MIPVAPLGRKWKPWYRRLLDPLDGLPDADLETEYAMIQAKQSHLSVERRRLIVGHVRNIIYSSLPVPEIPPEFI